MSNFIKRKTIIDPETGEILSEKSWLGFDGFNDEGYHYRAKATKITYFFDTLPDNYDYSTYMLIFMLAELMNEDNVLVYRVNRKSKFSNIIYKPMDKDFIREHLRFPMGINKFKKCWSELTKTVLKRVQYHTFMAWAVNPAIVNKKKYVPFWLYEEFQDYMNVHMTASSINKMQRRLLMYKELPEEDLHETKI